MAISRIKRLASWRPGRLARNTAHAGGWNVVRIALQAGSLVLMARVLGADGYGALAGTVALYVAFAQFVGLGSGIALVRHLARAGALHARLSATQSVYFITSVLLFALVWPLSIWVLGGVLTPTTLACLAAAELIVAPALLPLVYRYQAEERMSVSGAMITLAPIARFGAIVSALVLGFQDIATFAVLYLGCLAGVVSVTLYLAWPRTAGRLQRPSLAATVREGLPYVVSGVATTASGELDKTIVLRFSGSAITGQYAAAYRIMQAVTLPVNSLILSASARMFRSHAGRQPGFAGTLFLAVLGYALIAASSLWLVAPLIHIVLGEEFLESERYLRGLCLIVVTNCLRQLVTAHLTTSDLQRSRNLIEITGFCISLSLLLLLVPSIGPWGALIALGIADLSVIAMGGARIWRRSTSRATVDQDGFP